MGSRSWDADLDYRIIPRQPKLPRPCPLVLAIPCGSTDKLHFRNAVFLEKKRYFALSGISAVENTIGKLL